MGFDRLRRVGEQGGGRQGPAGRPECRCRRTAASLGAMDRSGHVDPGFPMDSAWRGALPPDSGFAHIDDVPARVVLDLAQRGVALAKEHGSSHGPPVSLLDQEVLAVSSEHGDVDIPMRCVFALTAMGFLPQSRGESGYGVGSRDRRRRRDRASARATRVAAHRRSVRFGVPPPRRPRAGFALTPFPRACVSAADTPSKISSLRTLERAERA